MPVTNPPSSPSTVTVVGIGADGWTGVPEPLRTVVLDAATVIAGSRHLALLPDVVGQQRLTWPAPLRAGLLDLLANVDKPVVAVASGDPLVSGIGTTLIDLLGPDRVRIHPGVSSVALARAELRWSAESCTVVSVVGRAASAVLRELAPGRRVLVLSSDENTPAELATLLTDAGYGASRMHALGDLGSSDFVRTDGTASTWSAATSRLTVIGLDLVGPQRAGWVAGLPDSAFENDGQLTKRDLRASALSRLAPAPGEHLWDVGAGAGSVGIEWMRAHPTCTATAIEGQPDRAERIARNAAKLGVPGLQIAQGQAPQALADLAGPDAIFVGGGATNPGVIDVCLSALRPGGRVVVHAVTLETEQVLADQYRAHGGELTRIGVETATAIGSYTGWTPARTVTQWSFTRPDQDS